ncbi:hypothetical protein KCU88_g70, partial [Aureobasidium melanogenum]
MFTIRPALMLPITKKLSSFLAGRPSTAQSQMIETGLQSLAAAPESLCFRVGRIRVRTGTAASSVSPRMLGGGGTSPCDSRSLDCSFRSGLGNLALTKEVTRFCAALLLVLNSRLPYPFRPSVLVSAPSLSALPVTPSLLIEALGEEACDSEATVKVDE